MPITDIFHLPRSDRKVLLFLFVVIAIVGILIYVLNFIGLQSNDISDTYEDLISAKAYAAMTATKTSKLNKNPVNPTKRKLELFYFDPNTADSNQLMRLGLESWQIKNLLKYRSKGGVYRTKEDFAYVYGLTVKQYRRLTPYIQIAEEFRPASSLPEVRQNYYYKTRAKSNDIHTYGNSSSINGKDSLQPTFSPKIKKGETILINTADTTLLKTIPGIGSYFARQIANYRKRLGGFVSKEQILEIEYFPEEALDYISINKEEVIKLEINRLTLSQLRSHPYINYYQARAICDYRRLHGEIRSINDLKLMKEFSDLDLRRIKPYLKF